jgi:hypothetical protein
MKKCIWLLRSVICIGLLQVVSCTKTLDTTTNDSVGLQSSNNATAADDFSDCKLRSIYHDLYQIDGNIISVRGLFSYNPKGNPVSLLYDLDGIRYYSLPAYHFVYDSQHRLKEWRLSYENGEKITTIHRFSYNSSNVIIADTTIFPQGAGQPDIFVSTLSYDSEGRIIKESISHTQSSTSVFEPTRNPTYTYDNRGNLGVNGWKSSWYDYKTSFRRTHPLFMFITRNYSRNNPYTDLSVGRKYNSRWLPLSVVPGNDEFFASYPSRPGHIKKLLYDCQ